MADKISSKWNPDEFVLPCQAMQDTVWFTDPADPTKPETGSIHKDELIWLHQELFGSGPSWQPARIVDGSVRFVNPHHFNEITH